MPGAGDVDHVEVVLLDDPVQVRVNEVLPRRRSPMPEQHVLHIRERQRPLQQRIVVEINLADRKIVGGAPVGVHLVEQFRGKSFLFRHDSFSCFSAKAEDCLAMTFVVLASPVFNRQQCLYFFPLPHGHGAFRPYLGCRENVSFMTDAVS